MRNLEKTAKPNFGYLVGFEYAGRRGDPLIAEALNHALHRG